MPWRLATAGNAPRVDARVDDRHLRAARLQIERALIAAIVVRRDDRDAARQHAVAMDVRRHGRRGHHARQIVIAEHERPLVRARGEDHALGAHLPDHLARALAHRHRQMIGEPLHDGHEVVILIAERGAAREDAHVGQLRELRLDLLDPLQRRLAVDLRAAREQAAAQLALIVDEDHARTVDGRRMRGREPRRAAADDEHVAVRVALVVAVGVERVGRLAEAGRLADLLFVLRPQIARPHERLVVEARRQEARELLHHRHPVVLERRLRVYARRDEPLIQLDLGRARVRHRVRAGFELHDGVRLVDARRHDPARTVVLEAARDEVHAVGEQRRRERVALEALIRAAVEREGERLCAVDAPACAESVFLAHLLVSFAAWAAGVPNVS